MLDIFFFVNEYHRSALSEAQKTVKWTTEKRRFSIFWLISK